MIWIVVLATVLYVFLIITLLTGWEKLAPYLLPETPSSTFVSVIIPMRNEEANIKDMLRKLIGQNYPAHLFEIIVVDDHSNDQSLREARSEMHEQIKIFELPGNAMGKKNALAFGIEKSKGELILTSDADCSVGKNWIAAHAGYYEKYHPIMMLGPVCGIHNSLFSKIQALEMYSLLGSSAGAARLNHAIMCNGANLSFSRQVYPDIKKIYTNQAIRSGDDMFVLQLLKKKYPKQIHYIKSRQSVVFTNLSNSVGSFLQQRRRWAAKAVFYSDPDILLSGAIVLITNLLILTTLALAIVSSNYTNFLYLILAKSVVDFLFLMRITDFFKEKRLMFLFPLVQSFYFLYVCFTVLSSLAFSNKWKERAIKH